MLIKGLISVVLIALVSFSASALNELGSLADAQKNHPAIFIPGNVLEYRVGGQMGYVFNGGAEKDFSGSMGEKDAELLQEALLDAKANLLQYFQKKDKSPDLSISLCACVTIYSYLDGKMRRIVCFVKKDNVVKQMVSNPSALPLSLTKVSSASRGALLPMPAIKMTNKVSLLPPSSMPAVFTKTPISLLPPMSGKAPIDSGAFTNGAVILPAAGLPSR